MNGYKQLREMTVPRWAKVLIDKLEAEHLERFRLHMESADMVVDLEAQLAAVTKELDEAKLTISETTAERDALWGLAVEMCGIIEEYANLHYGDNGDPVGADHEAYSRRIDAAACNVATASAHSWRRTLLALTPGGSEFADDPSRCAEFVQNKFSRLRKLAVNAAKEVRS